MDSEKYPLSSREELPFTAHCTVINIKDMHYFSEFEELYELRHENSRIRLVLCAQVLCDSIQGSVDWIFYRHQHFSVSCSCNFTTNGSKTPLSVQINHKLRRIQAFGISLTAVVDGTADESVEVIECTTRGRRSQKVPVKMKVFNVADLMYQEAK